MIEQKFMIDKISIIAETFPINWLSTPKINAAINENQNIENNNLFTKPFHSILLNKINPHIIPVNGINSNILYLPHILNIVYTI